MQKSINTRKITLVVTSLRPTGPIKIVEEIVKENSCNCQFVILVIGYKNYNDIEFPRDINIIYLNSRFNFFNFYDALKQINSDIIHCHGFRSLFFQVIFNVFSKKPNLKTIITMHSDIFTEFPIIFGKIKSYLFIKIYKFLISKIDLVICGASHVRDNLIKNFKIDDGKVVAIKNGVKISDTYNLIKDKNRFITVSHLSKLKNIKFLINVFKNLDEDYQLYIYGRGDQATKLKNSLYKNNKNIFFIDFHEEISEVYQTALCYLSASKSEGLPLSVLEAVTSGCNLLLSNIRAHQEIIRDLNMKTDNLFELDEFESLKDKLFNIKKFNRKTLKHHVSKSRRIYSSEVMAKEYFNMYKKLINEKQS